MIAKKRLKNNLVRVVFGWFFAIIALLGMAAPMIGRETVHAVETGVSEESSSQQVEVTTDGCKDSLGAVGWLVCPVTGKVAEGVDALYDKLEDFLVVEPISMEDGSPVYEIWKYCLIVTNIVFIIFLLVVIYSQITGFGISNYGIKKALPKLIVTAVLVNMSFLICSLAVDLSNTIGNGLTGLFNGIEQSAAGTTTPEITMSKAYGSVAGGAALAVGAGLVLFDPAVIWMLIPVALGAIVAVATGLFMVALRQAVVVLLIMVAPLAFVAYILPNTESLFRRWKQLFIKMMTFYPLFSLLFGASSLAGFAIIMSAKTGFGILLGLAVQIFPLFFSVSLMKMSGTFLGGIYSRIQGITSRPLASSRAWADSHRQLTRQKNLASNRAILPSLALMSFLSKRRIAREEEINEHAATVKNRGLAYGVSRKYKNGVPTRDAEKDYEAQAKNMEYTRKIEWHKNNMNKGLGQLAAVKANASTAKKARLGKLDIANVNAADALFTEKSRGEKIEYENAMGRHKRFEDAINAHFDSQNRYKKDENGNDLLDENERKIINREYRMHNVGNRAEAMRRYGMLSEIMEGDTSALDAQFAAANAAHAYDTQAKIITTKFQKYFELVPPTRDVRYRLEEFSKFRKMAEDGKGFDIKASDNIDAVISGMRILNQRGDTDFVKNIMDDILDKKYGGVELGTHASQALASFLMFEVKDNDPYLRRFGKYINLETARMYDENERKKRTVDYDEYILGYHTEPNGTTMHAKKDIVKLMEGTPLDGVERTAFDNFDKSLRKVYTDKDGKLDLEAYEARKREVDKATAPQFISANMKFLSGSEQIVSAVKAKTGYMSKQDKETGKYYMVPVWEDPKEAGKLFSNYDTDEEKEKAKKGLKKWYREQTMQYLSDQTPAQILGLRSDYKEPLLEHLSEAYLLNGDGEVIPEKLAKHNEELAMIENSNFGEVDPEKISEKRKAAREALRMNEAGEVFREILYKKGKLGQIEKSKRSGAANNAKDWVRGLLLLDTDHELKAWIMRREVQDGKRKQRSESGQRDIEDNNGQKKRRVARNDDEEARRQQDKARIKKMIDDIKEQNKQKQADAIIEEGRVGHVYSADDVAGLTVEVERIWDEVRDDSDEASEYDRFYEASHDFIVENLNENSYVARAYEKYYQENPNGDSYDLREFLAELLKTLLED